MKTILYNPIFINPQAYYVFPRLTRYLQPDNESTSEPANYIGTIEVKVIAYGDTTLKRTYTNTDSIDLSEFKNTWIRISLFTKVGSCVLGEWKIGNMESDLPYIDPEVLASLKAVVIVGNKTNNDSDRAIVKNLVDASNPFVINNAAFKLNSGYGKYEEDFTSWDRIDASTAEISNDGSKIKCINTILNVQYLFNSINKDIPSFKVKISNFTKGDITYYYRKEDGIEAFFKITPLSVVNSDKVIELPKSYNTVENGTGSRGGFYSSNINIGVTIEQIPSFEGAFVTDGVNDLITSTKTVQEMGVTDEITIVSMIHQIQLNPSSSITNDIRVSSNNTSSSNGRIVVSAKNKTGIYGWSRKGNTKVIITKILGDKNDYSLAGENSTNYNNKFSVVGTVDNRYNSSVAWYWTIIANKVLTTDQINQVIAYYNLDKYVKPDIYYNVKKQGLTNDTPDEDWYLKDFSGNGRDMTLYNYARTPESGINEEGGLQSDGVVDYGQFVGDLGLKDYTVVIDRAYNNLINNQVPLISSNIAEDQTPFIVEHRNTGSNAISFSYGTSCTTDIPLDINKKIVYQSTYSYMGYVIPKGNAISTGNGITLGNFGNRVQHSAICLWSLMLFPYSMSEFLIERQLKKYKLGTLYPDMVEFRPVIKTNTEWEYLEIYQGDNRLYNLSEHDDKTGIYLEENSSIEIYVKPYTGQKVSKIVYNGTSYIDLENNGYGYYYITVPVTKSPQKIGITIEGDENYVQWNPVVESNVAYKSIRYYKLGDSGSGWTGLNIGDYIPIGRMIMITIDTANTVDELVSAVSSQLTGIDINGSNGTYNITGTLTSESPQNINITIDEYIRYEDIVQPYPVLLRFKDENGNEVSWGGKFKVGSTITRIGSIADPESNLLNGLYSISGLSLNGKGVTSSTSIVEKQMVFKTIATYLLDNNEPKCILSPRLLRIPNPSYKILGYIPDISGHGNHGVIHNSAYAEGSGVNEDGSYQFDGVDDFVTIPTIVGGKQVLMKMNWQNRTGLLYDQRKNGSSIDAFAILNVNSNNSIAYNGRNTDGETYIDGILNKNIVCPQLYKITHSITIINQLANKEEVMSPTIGSDTTHKVYFSQMSLYDFMLFDNISTDDKIKQLNEYVGIEGNTE